MRARVLGASLAVLAAVAGCGGGPASPVTVAILGESGLDGTYHLEAASLTTVTSLTHLQGSAADLRGGASIDIDPQALDDAAKAGHLNTVDDFRRIILKDPGTEPTAEFTPERLDGQANVLVADDFSGLAMVTVYHHLEAARKQALAFGMPPTCLPSMTTYYDVDFVDGTTGSQTPQRDNAAFFPILESFLVLPFQRYQTVPLGMNPGVMAHEYHHGVWNCIIEQGKPIPAVDFLLDPVGQNFFRGLNEGLADFFGAETSHDPDFIRKSIPDIGDMRDLRVVRDYTQSMDRDARDGGSYDPYALGSVLASALWAIRTRTGDVNGVGKTVMRSLARLRTRTISVATGGTQFTPMVYLEELVAAFQEVAPSDESMACSVLQARFSLLGPISGCP